jgi:hypothetical protein
LAASFGDAKSALERRLRNISAEAVASAACRNAAEFAVCSLTGDSADGEMRERWNDQ